ncbi:MAG: hypothetical protein ACK45H_12395, partial [Bacteroidota bacterium]
MRSLLLCILMIISCTAILGQTVYTIGSGNSTSSNLPINSASAFSYSQSIYPASMLTGAGLQPGMAITHISWYLNTASVATNNNTWSVYIGNTSQGTFGSWIPITGLTQVATNAVISTNTVGWISIPLSTPFVWNGNNLVIAVDENSSGFTSIANMFRVTTSTTERSRWASLTTDISPNSPPTGSVVNPHPYIQLTVGCWSNPNNATIAINPAVGCAGSPITITSSGASSGSGISYQWQSSSDALTWTNIGVNSPNYNGSPTTSLYYQMISSCSYSGSSSMSNQVQYQANPVPVADISANGPITFCQGNSVLLSTIPEPGVTYQWRSNGSI